MAKKKKKKNNQVFLSPESYIKNKARNLEIIECLINEGWQEGGLAQIMVARKHKTGNITMGLFLVDTFCLGVKNTFFRFNISEYVYNDFKEEVFKGESVEIDYTLAHNIIYGALEFAEEYGFYPDKSFSNVTKYILDDDEDVDIIDLEFGKDGKPFLVITDENEPYKKYLSILDESAGPGNYTFMLPNDEMSEEFDEMDEFEEEYDDEGDYHFSGNRAFLEPFIYEYEVESKVFQMLSQLDNPKETPPENIEIKKDELEEITRKAVFRIMEYEFEDSVSDAEAEEAFNFGEKLFEGFEIDPDRLVEKKGTLPDNDLDVLSDAIEYMIGGKPKESLKLLRNLVKKHPDKPFLYSYTSRCYLDINKFKSHKEIVLYAYSRFPDDLGIRIDYLNLLINTKKIDDAGELLNKYGTSLKEMFPDKKVFLLDDVISFYSTICSYYIFTGNLLKAKSILYQLELIYDDYLIDDHFIHRIYHNYFSKLYKKYIENHPQQDDE